MKDQNQTMMTFNRFLQNSDNAILLRILNEIRKVAIETDQTENNQSVNSLSNLERSLISQRETILNLVEDAIEFSSRPDLSTSSIRNVDLTRLVSDFAETYLRKFGIEQAQNLFMFVDHKLPVVKSYPDKLIKLFSCIVRASRRTSKEQNLKIFVRESRSTVESEDDCQLVVSCNCIQTEKQPDEIGKLFEEFENGIYIKCIQDLGLELCSAMQIIREIGGTITPVSSGSEGIAIEIRLDLEKTSKANNTLQIPETIYFYTKSEDLQISFDMCAFFHGVKAEFLHNLSDIKNDSKVVIDVLNADETFLNELKAINDLSRIVLLIPDGDFYRLRKLSKEGFSKFIFMPMVSSQVIRSICGLDTYTRPNEIENFNLNRKLRVLIVDDAPTSRIVLKDYFESEGHFVLESSDGADFVSKMQRGEAFDLVFCDLTMNHMDGATAVKTIRNFEKNSNRHTPIVLMSAYSGIDKNIKEYFDKVLIKPLDLNAIKNTIKELFPNEIEDSKTVKNIEVVGNSKTEIIDLGDLSVRCAGKSKTMIRVLESFIETSMLEVKKLEPVKISKDRKNTEKVLHTIKGLLMDVGATKGYQFLEDTENKLNKGVLNFEDDFLKVAEIIDEACNSAKMAKYKLEQVE